jgi:hypothetical protein
MAKPSLCARRACPGFSGGKGDEFFLGMGMPWNDRELRKVVMLIRRGERSTSGLNRGSNTDPVRRGGYIGMTCVHLSGKIVEMNLDLHEEQ